MTERIDATEESLIRLADCAERIADATERIAEALGPKKVEWLRADRKIGANCYQCGTDMYAIAGSDGSEFAGCLKCHWRSGSDMPKNEGKAK